MSLETFTGAALAPLLARVKNQLGPDAVMVQTRRLLQGDGNPVFEVLAGGAAEASELHRDYVALKRSPAIAPVPEYRTRPPDVAGRPYVVALVGPTGAGKTTTAAKLAGHPRVFGSRRGGFLSLDTYRVGAIEQLRTYAEISGVPLEIAYDSAELRSAWARLAECEIVIVDTPGRSPKLREDATHVRHCLDLLHADEVHLLLPAGLQPTVAREQLSAYAGWGITHLLATKIDEVPLDATLFDLAAEAKLPMRWVTDGQEVPLDLHPARPRLLSAALSIHSREAQAEAVPA